MSSGFGDTPQDPGQGGSFQQWPNPAGYAAGQPAYPAVGQPAYPGAPGAPPPNPWEFVQYAGFFQRWLGYFIDGLIALLFCIPGFLVFTLGPSETGLCSDAFDTYVCEAPTDGTLVLAWLLYIAGIVLFVIFWSRRIGSTGQSPGKKIAGVRVIDARTGQPIGAGRAFGRYLCYIISGMVCYLGFFWAIWDPRKQAWHDKIVGTVVIKADT
ncbi:MAG: RDD family protein [Acidimicrobiia bacterium]|nr:RDD family protein [Acidimicrobiia bacterium]